MRHISAEHREKLTAARRRPRKPRKVSEIHQNTMPVRSELIPERYLKPLREALSGRASYRKAVKAKCIECVNFEDVLTRIRECTVKRCPLWRYRPFQKEDGDEQGKP